MDRQIDAYTQQVASVVRVHLAATMSTVDGPSLAGYLTSSTADVTRRLSGRSPWTLADLCRLAALFGMRPSDLFREAENRLQVV